MILTRGSKDRLPTAHKKAQNFIVPTYLRDISATDSHLERPCEKRSGNLHMTLRALKMYDLTHYETTNFRLFQTERVCRRRFQI